jgi:hypothetical protein
VVIGFMFGAGGGVGGCGGLGLGFMLLDLLRPEEDML